VNYLKEQVAEISETSDKILKPLISFCHNLLNGISYYRNLSEQIVAGAKYTFLQQLQLCENDIQKIFESVQTQFNRQKVNN
jgi:hypothetical protein